MYLRRNVADRVNNVPYYNQNQIFTPISRPIQSQKRSKVDAYKVKPANGTVIINPPKYQQHGPVVQQPHLKPLYVPIMPHAVNIASSRTNSKHINTKVKNGNMKTPAKPIKAVVRKHYLPPPPPSPPKKSSSSSSSSDMQPIAKRQLLILPPLPPPPPIVHKPIKTIDDIKQNISNTLKFTKKESALVQKFSTCKKLKYKQSFTNLSTVGEESETTSTDFYDTHSIYNSFSNRKKQRPDECLYVPLSKLESIEFHASPSPYQRGAYQIDKSKHIRWSPKSNYPMAVSARQPSPKQAQQQRKSFDSDFNQAGCHATKVVDLSPYMDYLYTPSCEQYSGSASYQPVESIAKTLQSHPIQEQHVKSVFQKEKEAYGSVNLSYNSVYDIDFFEQTAQADLTKRQEANIQQNFDSNKNSVTEINQYAWLVVDQNTQSDFYHHRIDEPTSTYRDMNFHQTPESNASQKPEASLNQIAESNFYQTLIKSNSTDKKIESDFYRQMELDFYSKPEPSFYQYNDSTSLSSKKKPDYYSEYYKEPKASQTDKVAVNQNQESTSYIYTNIELSFYQNLASNACKMPDTSFYPATTSYGDQKTGSNRVAETNYDHKTEPGFSSDFSKLHNINLDLINAKSIASATTTDTTSTYYYDYSSNEKTSTTDAPNQVNSFKSAMPDTWSQYGDILGDSSTSYNMANYYTSYQYTSVY